MSVPDDSLEFELEIPAKPKYVGLARLLAGSMARRMSFTEESIDDLKLAISEMCTNAIVHSGNGKNGKPPIIVHYIGNDDFLRVWVKDQGPGFDPSTLIEEDRNELLTKGFGIPLIKSLVDVFECDSRPESGTVVSITKYRRPGMQES
jgi:serine/threonine-protein kinase RsbW